MNNEIHRVLSLLEEGKISAQEATELIAALGSAKQTMGSAGSDEGPGAGRSGSAEGSREGGPDIIQIIGRALRRMARRQTRATWWRYYAFTDQHSRSRLERAATMTPADRVRRVATAVGLADAAEWTSEALLSGFELDEMARGLLRYAMADEFGCPLTDAEAGRWITVGDIEAWAADHSTPASESEQPPDPAATGESAAEADAVDDDSGA
ncbi:MAG: hypothetical protein HUU17_02385 [Chthonomonadales bacterium]|nr:hypothetical protein [Chthonomonadales bacterium]